MSTTGGCPGSTFSYMRRMLHKYDGGAERPINDTKMQCGEGSRRTLRMIQKHIGGMNDGTYCHFILLGSLGTRAPSVTHLNVELGGKPV